MHSVTEGAAGTFLECSCGRTVRVPSLNELRQQGLGGEVNPILEIEHLGARAELPQARHCAWCGEPTAEILPALVQCEKTRLRGPGGFGQLVLSFILFLFGGWLLFFLRTIIRAQEVLVGKELTVSVPLRMCGRCSDRTRGVSKRKQQRVLKGLLAKTPVYKRLLDRYPDARLFVLSALTAGSIPRFGSPERTTLPP